MMRLPISLPGDLSENPSYAEFAGRIRDELGESGPLERLILDRIAMNAWRLSRRGEMRSYPASAADRAEARAERSLHRSLEMLESLRSARDEFTRRPSATVEAKRRPVFHTVDREDCAERDDSERLCTSWRERLIFDAKTSESSPVVKGTWVTVDHVISLIVDNWSWADILRTHPELAEDDIRACLTYAIEQSHDETC